MFAEKGEVNILSLFLSKKTSDLLLIFLKILLLYKILIALKANFDVSKL
jgi:hypothetical protein